MPAHATDRGHCISDGIHIYVLCDLALAAILTAFVISAAAQQDKQTPLDWVRHALGAIFVVLCTWHLIEALIKYDDHECSRSKAVVEKKQELVRSYCSILDELDALLAKATNSEVALAERRIVANRREFAEFVSKALMKFENAFQLAAEAEAFLGEFRRFVRHWATIFAEAYAGPGKARLPLEAFDGELDLFRNLRSLADTVLERLQAAESRVVVSSRWAEDARTLALLRQRAIGELGHAEASMQRLQPSSASVRGAQIPCCSWIEASESGRLDCSTLWIIASTADLEFPVLVHLALLQVTFLSRIHVHLVSDLIVGIFLVLLNLTFGFLNSKGILEAPWYPLLLEMALVAVFSVGVLLLLTRIESISCLASIQQDVSYWQQESNRLLQVRDEMELFWADIQQLANAWIYYTIPRMDLVKRIHHELEATEPQTLVNETIAANQGLLRLQRVVGGKACCWGADPKLADQIVAISDSGSLSAVLKNLDLILTSGILEGDPEVGPPPAPPQPMLPALSALANGGSGSRGGAIEMAKFPSTPKGRKSVVASPANASSLAQQLVAERRSRAVSAAVSEYWEDETVSEEQLRASNKYKARL